jgi:phosphoglycerate dehydrogenase-like enzyme
VLTPHLSWYSRDAETSIREKIVEDIDLFAAGKKPRIPINPEALEVNKR